MENEQRDIRLSQIEARYGHFSEELAKLKAEQDEKMNQVVAELKVNQASQMAELMAQLRNLLPGTSSTAPPAPMPIAPNKERQKAVVINDGIRKEELVPKTTPVVVNLKEEKEEEVNLEEIREERADQGQTKAKRAEPSSKEALRLANMEEFLATQGYDGFFSDNVLPYAKVHVPENYQDPEFPNKYDGTGCPKSHLRYYNRKMARYADNALLKIHTFQDSLKGAALAWFIALDVEDLDTWEELSSEFLRQYRFNIEVLPTREDLTHTDKRKNEEFRAFAQRWRAVASRVKPPILEEELAELFLQSLPAEYYEKMYIASTQNFPALVKIGERIEREMGKKKSAEEQTKRPYFPKKGKESANEVAYVPNTYSAPPPKPTTQPWGTNTYSAPPPKPAAQPWGAPRRQEPRKKYPLRQFTPLPRPLSQLLPMLLEGHWVAKEIARNDPPRFDGFDENKTCIYHMGEKGHDVDNCYTLKNKVQNLIDRGLINFREPTPNVQQNPLPDHQGVNLIEDADSDDEYEVRRERRRRADRKFIEEARAKGEPLAAIESYNGGYRYMVSMAPPDWVHEPRQPVIASGWGEEFDEIDGRVSNRSAVLEEVFETAPSVEQAVSNPNEMEEDRSTNGDVVATITPFIIQLPDRGENVEHNLGPEPTTFVLTDQMSKMTIDAQVRPITIELPPRPIFDTKRVPWDYGSSSVGAITRSGRFYAPKQDGVEKKAVTEDDAKQVLSLIRTSEFEVVEQLRKMPAQISLLDLFKSSEKHKDALMKVLNEVHVPETINEVQLENFVGTILLKDQILFSDEDFPEEGRSHNKALYIAVKCRGKEIPRVLVDNGAAFNLCPLSTLRQIGAEKFLKTSVASIRSFDGAKKEVVGEVELEVDIGPVTFLVDFQVVDIRSSFNLLLGRPWIHIAGAVPSSLHQKVRLVEGGKMITIHAESDVIGHVGSDVPYVRPESAEDLSSAYYSLELIHVVHTPAGAFIRPPNLSASSIMSGKVLAENGFQPGKGLGKHAQGILEPIKVLPPAAKSGLGFSGEYRSSGRSEGRGRGRRGRGYRGGRSIDLNVWKGKAKDAEYFEISLNYTFPGPSKWLEDEDIYAAAEEDFFIPFEEDTVNAVITEVGNVPALE